jgi:hypothetical protein
MGQGGGTRLLDDVRGFARGQRSDQRKQLSVQILLTVSTISILTRRPFSARKSAESEAEIQAGLEAELQADIV